MGSNSKLKGGQKEMLQAMIAAQPAINFAFAGPVTIAFKHVGDNVEFATAICAKDEKKNRPSVGKYTALARFNAGCTVKTPRYLFEGIIEQEESVMQYWGLPMPI